MVPSSLPAPKKRSMNRQEKSGILRKCAGQKYLRPLDNLHVKDGEIGSDSSEQLNAKQDDKDSSVIESEEPINDVVDTDNWDQIGEEQLRGRDK